MSLLFTKSKFNKNISQWNTSNVQNMKCMFGKSLFNNNIFYWNTSQVTYMSYMFYGSEFNGDISQWNTSDVTTMAGMFSTSKFNQTMDCWNINNILNIENMNSMFINCPSPKPWWYIEDNQKRDQAIVKYQLMQKITNYLSKTSAIKATKLKI